MRHWEKKPDKPQVRAVIDRRQLILGMLTLLGMAVLLTVGLTPRSASAPDPLPDAAQAVGDAAMRLSSECQVVQRMVYAPCGHEVTRRQALPAELAGKTRADLEAAYDLWQVTSFAPGEVSMERTLDMFCPEHYVLLPVRVSKPLRRRAGAGKGAERAPERAAGGVPGGAAPGPGL